MKQRNLLVVGLLSAGTDLVTELIAQHSLIQSGSAFDHRNILQNRKGFAMKKAYLWRDIRWQTRGSWLTRTLNRLSNLKSVLIKGKPGYNFFPEWSSSLQEIADKSDKVIAVIPRSNHVIEELRLIAGLTDRQVRREVSEGLDMLKHLGDGKALTVRAKELYEDPYTLAERICEYLELDFDIRMLDTIDAILGPSRVTRLGKVA